MCITVKRTKANERSRCYATDSETDMLHLFLPLSSSTSFFFSLHPVKAWSDDVRARTSANKEPTNKARTVFVLPLVLLLSYLVRMHAA